MSVHLSPRLPESRDGYLCLSLSVCEQARLCSRRYVRPHIGGCQCPYPGWVVSPFAGLLVGADADEWLRQHRGLKASRRPGEPADKYAALLAHVPLHGLKHQSPHRQVDLSACQYGCRHGCRITNLSPRSDACPLPDQPGDDTAPQLGNTPPHRPAYRSAKRHGSGGPCQAPSLLPRLLSSLSTGANVRGYGSPPLDGPPHQSGNHWASTPIYEGTQQLVNWSTRHSHSRYAGQPSSNPVRKSYRGPNQLTPCWSSGLSGRQCAGRGSGTPIGPSASPAPSRATRIQLKRHASLRDSPSPRRSPRRQAD